jgi:hypothetical protein
MSPQAEATERILAKKQTVRRDGTLEARAVALNLDRK